MEKKTHIPVAYLRERLAPVLFYVIEACLFLMVAALYGYGGVLANMTYALGLAAFFGGCFLVWDYMKYREKYKALTRILSAEERSDSLPQTSSGMERVYQQIIMAQEAEKKALVTQLDEKQQNMADYYTMWTHQTGQYVDMALHYARMESISSDLAFARLDVDELVKKALKKFWLLFSGAGISLQLEACHTYVVTDGKWFSFVIEQVLSNALKYTKTGAISIYGTDESGARVTEACGYLVIEDTGIGIEESDLPRIFERGFTGYNGRMENKSTGIGLYLCRQIMDRLGLSIRVESERGRGTKVFLGIAQEASQLND